MYTNIGMTLGGFHHWMIHGLMVRHPLWQADGSWYQPPLAMDI